MKMEVEERKRMLEVDMEMSGEEVGLGWWWRR